jgi:probable H4MPT-linked C1 transfer pathway protein
MDKDTFIGWDIGGAHLKLACVTSTGKVTMAAQLPMPLWKGIHMLEQSLAQAKQILPEAAVVHSITTTAELVDIFTDRHSGISTLVQKISSVLNHGKIRFYAGRAGWVPPHAADQHAGDIASANWHATAAYVAGMVGSGILIDIGSTTTDIIMFDEGQVRYHGYSDYERLSSYELVYTGVVRTPVMAVTDKVPIAGKWQPVTSELFATMADVYRLTGELPGEDDMQDTPDGRGKSLVDSARRLARMFGTDLDEQESLACWQSAATYLAGAQLNRIDQALHIVLSRQRGPAATVMVGAGVGRFLAQKLAHRHGLKFMDFADLFETASTMRAPAAISAAAVSVAQLARLQQ